MQAIAAAAQSILLSDADAVLAGGMESMSRVPAPRRCGGGAMGHRMGSFTLVDAMFRDGFAFPSAAC